MKLEAMKRQGYRTDLTSDQVGQKLTSVETVAKQSGDSRTQVQRYIRLTELIPPILQMVDEGQIALTPAVELSFLKSIIDRCTASVYRVYQQSGYTGTVSTLRDFREELLRQDEPEAREIALAIELFTNGSLNTR